MAVIYIYYGTTQQRMQWASENGIARKYTFSYLYPEKLHGLSAEVVKIWAGDWCLQEISNNALDRLIETDRVIQIIEATRKKR